MKVVIGKQLINCVDAGSGPTILMMHGWGVDSSSFNSIALYLQKNFRVIRFDFPGFGGSPAPAGDWSVSDYVEVTSGVLKKLGVEDLYAVIGHSFGGRVAIKGVSGGFINPERVVLLGSAGVKPRNYMKKRIYKIIAKIGDNVTSLPFINKYKNRLKRAFYGKIGSSDYINSGKLKNTFVKVINEDLTPLIHLIKQPTLLIWGAEDHETPVCDAQKILSELPNGKLEIINSAGHFVYKDQEGAVLKYIEEFLA